jgi:lysozyme family protein
MANFKLSFNKTVKAEGGYVNDPNDKGGETYLGISRKSHPTSKMWVIIDAIKKEHGTKNLNGILKGNIELDKIAEDIYKKLYWDVMMLDKVPSQEIAHQLFDMGVNSGVSRAVKIAQRIMGLPLTGVPNAELIQRLMEYGKRR